MEEEFNKIVDVINNNKNNKDIGITTTNMIDFYKYYKQATLGDCNISEPSIFYQEARTKWQAWNSVKGMSKEDAMKQYCNVYYSIV
jgi:diazepam-binding inhibitor (GABA receptor modulating acyl-CoA-binding protein)